MRMCWQGCDGYTDIETWSTPDTCSDDQQSSLKGSDGTAMNGPPMKSLGTLAELSKKLSIAGLSQGAMERERAQEHSQEADAAGHS